MSLRITIVWLIVLFTPFIILAQDENNNELKNRILDIDSNQIERSGGQVVPQAQYLETSFENAIDAEAYILGPGDRLLIRVWGALESQFVIPVSPEGYVIVPGMEEIYVAQKSLAESAELIKAGLAEVFLNSKFSVRLTGLRKFRIFVAGEVENPGTYYLRAVDRVSDAVELAGGLADWGDNTRIQVTRSSNGKIDTVNISSFYLTGDNSKNSPLNGGDVVYVPPIDLTKNYAIIEGNVGSQGIYQILQNETLFSFLSRLRTINRKSNIEQVVLIRGKEKLLFSLLDPTSGARTEMLQTGDRVIVPSTQDKVYVQGEVIQPGALPYLANYSAVDYAGFAGILETARSLSDLQVIRANSKEIIKGQDTIVLNGDIVVVPRKKRETFKDYLTILTPVISLGISAFALIRASN